MIGTVRRTPCAFRQFLETYSKLLKPPASRDKLAKVYFFILAPWLTFAYQVLEIRLGRMQEWPLPALSLANPPEGAIFVGTAPMGKTSHGQLQLEAAERHGTKGMWWLTPPLLFCWATLNHMSHRIPGYSVKPRVLATGRGTNSRGALDGGGCDCQACSCRQLGFNVPCLWLIGEAACQQPTRSSQLEAFMNLGPLIARRSEGL